MKKLSIIENGFDETSEFGANIVSNNNFIFVSANGYNNFNGMVIVYFNNITKNGQLYKHSIINSPTTDKINFGSSLSINSNNILAISAILYNHFNGIVFLYKFYNNYWILYQTIYNNIKIINNEFAIGFGYQITINNNYLIISTAYNTINIYKYNYLRDKFIFSNRITSNDKNDISNKLLLFDSLLFYTLLNNTHNYIIKYNLLNNSKTIFYNNTEKNCVLGTDMIIYKNLFITSCSIPYKYFSSNSFYPYYYFKNFNNNYILIFYENNTFIFNTDQFNIDKDKYFGTNIDITPTEKKNETKCSYDLYIL